MYNDLLRTHTLSLPLLVVIHSKDVVAILHLLVALASYYRCKYHIPQNVKIKRIYLKVRTERELIMLGSHLFDYSLSYPMVNFTFPQQKF